MLTTEAIIAERSDDDAPEASMAAASALGR